MIKKIKRNYIWILCIALFAFMFYRHMQIKDFSLGDDSWFLENSRMGWLTFISWRYSIWTSRSLLESCLIGMVNLPPIVWYIVDSLFYVLIFYSSVKITKGLKKPLLGLFLCILCVSIPISNFNELGWYVTTINYIWPLAMGLYALSFIQPFYESERVKPIQWILFFISSLFAANQEQMCMILTAFYAFYWFVYLVQKKRLSLRLTLGLLIMSTCLVFHITCPGNMNRAMVETSVYFPEYAGYGNIQKVIIGCLSTTSYVLLNPSVIYFVFAISVFLITFRQKSWELRVLGILPTISLAGMLILLNMYPKHNLIKYLRRFSEYMVEMKTTLPMVACLFIGIVLVGIIFLVLYKSLEFESFVIITMLIGISLLANIVMGFSTTIYMTKFCTFIFSQFLLIIGCGFILRKLIYNK